MSIEERLNELLEIAKQYGNYEETAGLCNSLAVEDMNGQVNVIRQIFQTYKTSEFGEKVADICADMLLEMKNDRLHIEPKYNTNALDNLYTNSNDQNTQAFALIAMAIENMTQAINKQTEMLYETMSSLTQVTQETQKNQELLMQNQNAIANRQVSIANRQVTLAERNERAYAMVLGQDGKTYSATYGEFVENSSKEEAYKGQGKSNYNPYER